MAFNQRLIVVQTPINAREKRKRKKRSFAHFVFNFCSFRFCDYKLVLSKDMDGKVIPVSLIATYKNSKGIFEPKAINIDGVTGKVSDDSMVFELTKSDKYIVVAGKKNVEVDVQDAGFDTKPDTPTP